MDFFKSKDLDQYEKIKAKMFDDARFVNQGDGHFGIVYATYPRSGNTLMRKYFESCTGTATGSDMVMKHGPNVSLQFTGFKGEGNIQENTWIKKSHYPLTMPF